MYPSEKVNKEQHLWKATHPDIEEKYIVTKEKSLRSVVFILEEHGYPVVDCIKYLRTVLI